MASAKRGILNGTTGEVTYEAIPASELAAMAQRQPPPEPPSERERLAELVTAELVRHGLIKP